MFLTADELRDLTGYVQQAAQARWLADNGYQFDLRSDGRPNVLRQQVVERQCRRTESKPVPNLAFLEKTG